MDFLEKRFGDKTKVNLVRELVKERIAGDSLLRLQYGSPEVVDTWSDLEVMALPEGTIVAIVETYYALKKQGLSDEEIFSRINTFRSEVDGMRPLGAYVPDLTSFIKWRLLVEHSHGRLPDLEACVARARSVFGP